MAVINGTLTFDDNGVARAEWKNLLNGDTGSLIRMARFSDKTVQVVVEVAGVGDAITMEGSPDSGTTFG